MFEACNPTRTHPTSKSNIYKVLDKLNLLWMISSYRAELLGLCALHHLAQAIADFHKVAGWSAMLCCDNKRALEVSSYRTQRIRPSAKCADIRRSLKAIKPSLGGTFCYIHVYGHMDKMLRWEQLSLTQQLNCVCDTLAKRSVLNAIANGYGDRSTQFLPREDVALVIWGKAMFYKPGATVK